MKDAVHSGKKCCTTRSKKYGEIGDVFYVGKGLYKIIEIEPATLGYVTSNYYRQEGCDTTEEFIELWKSLHRGNYSPTKSYFVHFFGNVDLWGGV